MSNHISQNRQPPVAVIGTYRSGSSLIAGMLSQLGVDMGAPFWGDYFEPLDLSQSLRRWWQEPELKAAEASSVRVHLLRQWLDSRTTPNAIVGAKHPLLSLSAHDIKRAWGSKTRFVWIRRSLDDAIQSLEKMQWFKDAETVQRKLAQAADEFFVKTPHLRIEFDSLRSKPQLVVQTLIDHLGLSPDSSQLLAAESLVRPQQQEHVPLRNASPLTTEKTLPVVATILTGNCEHLIGEAVSSVVDWVDAILLIDTGITDGTLQIAEQAAQGKLIVRAMQWTDDFGAARNQALTFVREIGGQWAITLDTDERLQFADPLVDKAALLAYLDRRPAIDVWLVPSSDRTYFKERILRVSSSTLRWQGRVHEALHGVTPNNRDRLEGMQFVEKPKSPQELAIKFERDTQLLRLDIRDNPDSGRYWYYLGQTLANLGQSEGAITALDRCSEMRDWDELAAWACYVCAKSLAQLELYDEAIERCATGLAIDAEFPELAWMAGWCYYRKRDFRQAIVWSHMSIALGCVAGIGHSIQRLGFRDLSGWYEGPFDILYHAYAQLGDTPASQQAQQDYQNAIRLRTQRGD